MPIEGSCKAGGTQGGENVSTIRHISSASVLPKRICKFFDGTVKFTQKTVNRVLLFSFRAEASCLAFGVYYNFRHTVYQVFSAKNRRF